MIWLIVAVLVLCLLLGKREMVFRIMLRAIVGGVAIVTVNMALDIWGMTSYVGVNMVTLSVCGFLGLPGILGLYGLSFYQYFY